MPETQPSSPTLPVREIAGIYAVRQDKPFDPSIYSLDITGVSLRTYWKNIEPERGQFNWLLFDEAIRSAAATGKKVRLCIMFGYGVPQWVGAKWFRGSADSEYDTANVEMPIPWDENLKREVTRINAIFAERYRDNPTVAFFHISGPSSKWEELALPKNIVDQPGYTPDVILQCWKEIIDQWKQIRGDKRISVAVSAATSVDKNLGEKIMEYAIGRADQPNEHGALGEVFVPQWNYLDTLYAKSIRERSALWGPKTIFAWQMWGSTQWPRKCNDFPGTIHLAADVNSTYLEIYQEDLLVPNLARQVEELNRSWPAKQQGQ